MARLCFDPKTAFAPVGFIAEQESVLVGSAGAPWADLKAIIAAAKANSGSVPYGTIVYTLLAPSGTPPTAAAKLNAALNAVVSTPQGKEDLRKRGFVPMGGTPPQFADWLKIQEPIWVPILKAAGIKPE